MTNRPAARLARLVNVRPGEAALAAFFFLYFFLVTAPFNIVKSVRDGSYLDELGARNLPYAYATAILIGGVVALHSRLQTRVSRRNLLRASLAFFALTAALFAGLFAWGGGWLGGAFRRWLPLPFYLWVNVFAVVLVTQFWFCVNDVFNPREAKRLIGFFGSGGILGGIAGGLAAGFLARPLGTPGLLLLSGALLAAGAFVVGRLFRATCAIGEDDPTAGPGGLAGDAVKIGFKASWEAARADPLLKLIGAAVFLAGIATTVVDWQTKTVIEEHVLGGRRTAFFGIFNAGLLVLAFVFQLVLTSRVIRRLGLRRGLMIYPAFLLLGVAGIAVAPALAVAVLLKGADKALSYSLHQSSRELLYIPVPQGLKYRAKAFIDMFLSRFSRTAGAMLILAVVLPFGADRRGAWPWAAGLAGAAIAGWIVLNLKIGGAYLRTVREQLGRSWKRGDEVVGSEVDVDAAKLIVDALESRSRSSTLYALDLFELSRAGRLTPEVGSLLAQGVAEAAAPGRNPMWESDEVPWMPDLAEALPADVLERNVREIMALPSYRALMADYARRVAGEPGRESETAKMELAKAAGLMGPDAPAALALEDLLREDSPDVFRYAAASAGALRRREFVAALVAKLCDPKTRNEARSALEKYGPSITGALGDYLADLAVPEETRREVAAVLARIATEEAAAELLERLARGAGSLESDLIDALDRIRVRNSEIVFSPDAIEPLILKYARPAGPGGEAADPLILFKLVGLLYDHETVFRAYQSFRKRTKDDVALAVELLDETLPRELKERLLAVLEPSLG
jgi:ATP/ADP translocase